LAWGQAKGGTIVGHRRSLFALLAVFVGSAVLAQTGSTARGHDGGILRISVSPSYTVDYVDPALSFSPAGWSLLEVTCARLYTYRDEKSPRSFRLQPEVASGYSRSKDLRTYTLTLRRGFRFSNGEPVRASAFARAINRVLVVQSPGAFFMRDIVGADDLLAGRTKKARGVRARGNTLVVRFKRPAPDFLARTALPFFCAVPPWLPPSDEGLGKIHSAGPYYVKEYRPKEGIVIRRNRFYGGERKVHLDGFNVNLQGGNPVELLRSIERGDADWGPVPAGVFEAAGLELEAKYGRNKSRFWVRPGLTLRLFAFNSSRPLFRNNPRLRQAVNFALDRRALSASSYGRVLTPPTDQLLPHSLPGFRDANVYPLEGDLERARRLANGRLRSGKAVLHVTGFGPLVETAQLVKRRLASIGLEVKIEIGTIAATGGYVAELTRPRAEWDIAFVLWTPNIPEAHMYLSLLLEKARQGGEARSKRAGAALARAARLPQGRTRNLAYAKVDEMIARDVTPVAVLGVLNEATLLSERVGCRVLRPALDLAVACLRD
jgi:ABC-type transport system substrate-binding protein